MRSLLLVFYLAAILSAITAASSDAADNQKTEPNKGLTIEDIGRGLKSAAKNIGEEIPKIGPAIGETFKKVTGQEKPAEKSSTEHRPKDKK